MFYTSIQRFCEPVQVKYTEAIMVSIIGLIVNIFSAKILHHDEEHSDHNLKATYLHILADILTSVLALLALLSGLLFKFHNADAIVGIVGAIVIIFWAKSIIVSAWKTIFIKN
jgi:cation diffusion facilitator family transporter